MKDDSKQTHKESDCHCECGKDHKEYQCDCNKDKKGDHTCECC